MGENSSKTNIKKPPIVQKRNNWITSVSDAFAKAEESGKPVFAFFTGKDWCQYCNQLDHEILNTDTFAKWARENVVLLELDFPQGKQVPEAYLQLRDRLRIQGYPTIVVLDTKMRPLVQAGYFQVSPEKWVSVLDEKMRASLAELSK